MSTAGREDGIHSSAALYLLGALDEEAETAFERHLAHCARCQQDCADLGPVVVGLSQIPDDDLLPLLAERQAEAAGGVPHQGAGRRTGSVCPGGPRSRPDAGPPQRRHVLRSRPLRLALLGVSAMVALSVGVAIGVWRQGGSVPGEPITTVGVAATAEGVQDATRLAVTVIGRGEDSSVLVTIVGLDVGVRYRLYAVTTAGVSLPVAEWSGAEGVQELTGEVRVPPDEMAFFSVTRDDGTAVVRARLAGGEATPARR